MKLATLKSGGRDGTLVLVSRDLSRAVQARAAPTLLGSTSQMAVRGLQAVRESAKNAPFGGTRPVGGHRAGEHSEKRVDKFVRWAVYKLDIMLEQHP